MSCTFPAHNQHVTLPLKPHKCCHQQLPVCCTPQQLVCRVQHNHTAGKAIKALFKGTAWVCIHYMFYMGCNQQQPCSHTATMRLLQRPHAQSSLKPVSHSSRACLYCSQSPPQHQQFALNSCVLPHACLHKHICTQRNHSCYICSEVTSCFAARAAMQPVLCTFVQPTQTPNEPTTPERPCACTVCVHAYQSKTCTACNTNPLDQRQQHHTVSLQHSQEYSCCYNMHAQHIYEVKQESRRH